jgi:hypothetical protein
VTVLCHFCEQPVDPGNHGTWQRMSGWQRIAGVRISGKHGGSDIRMRQPEQEWAHGACLDRAKSGRHNQGSLL